MTTASITLPGENASSSSRRVARTLLGIALALALASWTLLALSFGAPVPDFWGFPGHNGLLAFVFAITGYVIATRRPQNPIGWCFLAIGDLNAVDGASMEYGSYALFGPGGTSGGAVGAWVHDWIWVFYVALIGTVFLYFPNGRLPSPRWRPALWVLGIASVCGAALNALRPGPLLTFGVENPFGVVALGPAVDSRNGGLTGVFLGVLTLIGMAAVGTLVRRFARSRGDERQQLKWFAASAALITAVFAATYSSPESKLGQIAEIASLLGIPIAIGIAILRYRLYEIDTIINLALVYGALTAILAGVFAASTELLKRTFVEVTGGSSDLAVVLAIFLVVAVFEPVRGRVKGVVDLRFRAAQPALAATGAATGTSVPQLLGELADLRDRGVLTDAEFQAKKRDLLARL